MGQSVTRVNDHHSVPGPLGHGMAPTPQVGVGIPHGGRDVTPEDETHPHALPHRKPTLPPSEVNQIKQAEINQLKQQHIAPQSSSQSPKLSDESLLRRGWQATIGKFRHKPDDNEMQSPPKGVSDEAQVIESAHSIPNHSLSPIAPSTTITTITTTTTTRPLRAHSMPVPLATPPPAVAEAATAVVENESPSTKARRVTASASAPSSPALKSKSLSNLDTGKSKDDMQKTNWQSSTPIALGMNTSGVVATPPGTSRKLNQQPMIGSGQQGGFGEWWRQTLTMPPKYSPMNVQPDELHREHRSLSHGPIYFGKETAMPPKLSPWNAQPDELHRESHKWR